MKRAIIVARHLNGDEHIDLATASLPGSGSAAVSVLFGNGDGTFADALSIPVNSAWPVAIADANGDERNDLVVGKSSNPDLKLLLHGT